MSVAPFPFASLERVSLVEVRAGNRVRRYLRSLARTDALAAALGALAKAEVRVLARGVWKLDPAKSAAGSVGVVLAAAEGGTPVLIELEAAFAGELVSRVLGRETPRVLDASRSVTPELAGAIAAIVLAAARRAHQGVALKVVAAGPSSTLARDVASAHPSATCLGFTVVLGDEAFHARVSAPADATPEPQSETVRAETPIALPLVLARCLATRAEIAALAKGDVFVVPSAAIHDDGGALVAPALLVAPRAERGLAGSLAPGGRLALRDGREPVPWDDPRIETTNTSLQGKGDAPVVVRVELGVVEMTAKQWTALGAGDVVALGRRVGDAASIRVAGVEIARGELVKIDGEYGVRIVARGEP